MFACWVPKSGSFSNVPKGERLMPDTFEDLEHIAPD